MTVHWTENALRQLAAIHDYIARDSESYARGVVDRITRKSARIAIFPHLAQVVPEFEREDIRQVVEWPYRIIYRVKPEQVDILAVVHGARLLPPGLTD